MNTVELDNDDVVPKSDEFTHQKPKIFDDDEDFEVGYNAKNHDDDWREIQSRLTSTSANKFKLNNLKSTGISDTNLNIDDLSDNSDEVESSSDDNDAANISSAEDEADY